MAHDGPERASRGLQEGPPDGSEKDLGTNLAESSLQDPPGTLPGPSWDPPGALLGPSWTPPGSDFLTNLGPKD